MIPLPFLKDKQVGVLGLGKTGNATVRALQAAGARVVAWDDNAGIRDQASGIRPLAEWPWESLDLVVLSPGLPYTHPAPHEGVRLAREHGVEIVGDIELLYRACPDATFIAITGTNGKSTTTSLIAHILKEAGRAVEVGGNLGVPALMLEPLTLTLSPRERGRASGLAGAKNEALSLGRGWGEGVKPIYVLELSSYQLDLVRTTRFDVAVLLNFSPDHLDRHGDMDGYIAAKKHIFDRQTADDVAVIGVDDATSEALCREMIAAGRQQVVPIMTTQTSDKGVWVKDGVLYEGAKGEGRGASLADMKTLQGTHNHQNAAAAWAACRAAGLSADEIIAGMRSYPGLAHRMQRVAEKDGMLFINDSKATNADAAAKSLGTYENIYWIAGGVAKAGGIEPLAPYFPRIRHAFLIGAAQDAFAQTLEGQVAYTKCGDLASAVNAAVQCARKDGMKEGARGESRGASVVILLAPACASFDQFKSFEERGEVFVELVARIR